MSENKKIIQEFFFKKKKESYVDKMKKKVGEYKPQDVRQEPGEFGFGGILDLRNNPKTGESFVSVTDPKEAGKRVVSALGASLGINSIRNMASRSIKSFPIIISENVDPETSVMIKRVMEEQYAEYVSLLISNQIVDISAFKTTEEEGNIAIQALDTVSSEEESKKMARKLSKGEISPETLLGNLTAYNLMRNESKEYKTNNAIIDSILEGAVIVPSEQSKGLLEFYHNYSNDIVLLNEYERDDNRETSEKENKQKVDEKRFISLDKLILKNIDPGTQEEIIGKRKAFDAMRGYEEIESDNVLYTRWTKEETALKARLATKETEISNLRVSAKSDPTDIKKLIEKAQNDLERLELERSQISRKVTATEPRIEELEEKDLEIAQKRRQIERLEISMRTPSLAVGELRAAERERDMIERDIQMHSRKEPTEQKTIKSKYTRLTAPDVVLDAQQLRDSSNRSLGEILLNQRNEAIRDKFEKATFLLQANRIAGAEYIEYLVQRLGIPVPKDVRKSLVANYRIGDIVDPQKPGRRISKADIKRLYNNETATKKALESILEMNGKIILKTAITAAVVAAGGIAAVQGPAVIASLIAMGPLALPGVILGAAGLSYLAVKNILQLKKLKAQKERKIQGWERVELLIRALEEQQESIRRISVVKSQEEMEKEARAYKGEGDVELTSKEVEVEIDKYKKYLNSLMAKSKSTETTAIQEQQISLEDYYFEPSFEDLDENYIEAVTNIILNDEGYKKNLEEAVIQTTIPSTLELKYEYDTDKKPELLVAPKFATRSQYAYGSTEYDKRELKDRRYNAPLLMKVNFKERFSDGTFSDNELTAVIGILGVITRVPSKEMEYILSSNADGNTVKGIFEPEGDPTKLISNILGIDKISKDVDNLPQSSDVWQNLEKVSRLAVSNKLAGKKNDNIANAHIVFAQKEIDNVRGNDGYDYLKNMSLVSSLMKRYSAFTIMVANDVSERLYIFDDLQSSSWDIVPYSAFRNKDTGDQLNAMLTKMSSGRL